MKIAVPKEILSNETRVAATPDIVKKYIELGFKVAVEKKAGEASGYSDKEYENQGAEIVSKIGDLYKGADIILKVSPFMTENDKLDEMALLESGMIVISNMNSLNDLERTKKLAQKGVTAFAMELMPRISRAQSMDILSSQSNLAGYRAVIEAAYEYNGVFPMMMTAAGTVAPTRVLVLGAGVAGLQAIATAKRLGAIVSAYDVRPAVKEQVESLGAKFVVVDEDATKEAETKTGYAKEMNKTYQKKQEEVLTKQLEKTDVVICTALIMGKQAPVLINDDMLSVMKKGAVIVDLAVETGGNCSASQMDKIVEKEGVKVIGRSNMAGRVASNASQLYAKNVFNFITQFFDSKTGSVDFNFDDDLVKGTCVAKEGKIVHNLLIKKG
ncbi:MAG: Re/Si-specific NAD(P)(+) transhydrogenase subunit alpha [Alphaproteobacteria bacterium]